MPADAPVRGRLLLVPNTLDLGAESEPLQALLPHAVIHQASQLSHWVVENARSARAFLKRVHALEALAQPLQALDIQELPRPQKGGKPGGEAITHSAWEALLKPALSGHDLGLLSEAGLPAVADPGAALVAAAHRAGLVVWPLAGASSILLALAASGLNGQSFAFVGYLPQDAAQRNARLRELEQLSQRQRQTQLFIETPYRNSAIWQAMLQTLAAGTQVSVSVGLTLPGGFARTATVARWREQPLQLPDKVPAVFALLA